MAAQHARYLFVDLDALVTSVKLHVQAQPFDFSEQLQRIPLDDVALEPQRLTAMLEDVTSLVICHKGSYFKPHGPDADALKAIGWDMKKKGAASHRTLENLLDKAFQDAGVCLDHEPKTLVLATGFIVSSVLSSLEIFLQANWRVQVFFAQRCQQASLEQMRRKYLQKLQFVYIDHYIQDLLINRQHLAPMLVPPGAAHLGRPTRLPPATIQPRASFTPSQYQYHQQLRGPRPQASPQYPSTSPPHGSAPFQVRGPASFKPRGPAPPQTRGLAPPQQAQTRAADPAAAAKEQSLVDKRFGMLQAAQSQYTTGNRQRFVYMDFDNITAGLFSSHHLYQRVPGARSARDLYVNLEALTNRICGDNPAMVQTQLATYYNSNELMARGLGTHRWQVQKQETVSDTTLQLELLSQLIASTTDSKTLVLVTGDGNIAANNKSFKAIVDKYLQQNWFVEIHAWLHSLSESYIEFQRAYPQHVVVRPLDSVFPGIVTLKLNVPVPAANNSAAVASRSPPRPSHELLQLTRQLQEMQDTFLALRVDDEQRGQLQQQNAALVNQIRAQEELLEAERTASQVRIAQTESDALLAQRFALQEREDHLTCPITCQLYENPVTVSCCGKTFSEQALAEHRRRNSTCPWCRSATYTTLVNRDLAALVELLKQQQAALEG